MFQSTLPGVLLFFWRERVPSDPPVTSLFPPSSQPLEKRNALIKTFGKCKDFKDPKTFHRDEARDIDEGWNNRCEAIPSQTKLNTRGAKPKSNIAVPDTLEPLLRLKGKGSGGWHTFT